MNPNFVPARRLLYSLLVSFAAAGLARAVELQAGINLKSHASSARSAKSAGETAIVTVAVTPGHPANRFVPARTLGACVDGMKQKEVSLVYTPANIHAMRSAGLGPLAYRLRTELAVETWHW